MRGQEGEPLFCRAALLLRVLELLAGRVFGSLRVRDGRLRLLDLRLMFFRRRGTSLRFLRALFRFGGRFELPLLRRSVRLKPDTTV